MSHDRKERQRKAVVMIEDLMRLSTDRKAEPPVIPGVVGVVKYLLIDEDQGGEGLTSLDLEGLTGLSQASVSKALKYTENVLRSHFPESGIVFQRERQEGKNAAFIYSLKWATPCPVCHGSGICETEEVSA